MKTLYESILDDEDVLINKAEKYSDFVTVYNLLKNNKSQKAADFLNKNFKVAQRGEWIKDTPLNKGKNIVLFYNKGAGIGIMKISNCKEGLKFSFPEFFGHQKNLINEFEKYYNMTYDNYKNWSKNLVKELNLEKDSSTINNSWILKI